MFWLHKLTNLLPKTTSLSKRLSLWYIITITTILVVFFISLGTLFWITLRNQIDHHIHITVNEAAQIVETFSGIERDQLLRNLVSAQGMTIVVLSPDGSPIIETNSPDIALVTEHQLQRILGVSSFEDQQPIHFTESTLRFAAMPVSLSSGKGILAVGYSTQVIYSTFYNMTLISFAVLLILVFPLTYIGYKLLTKQLSPVTEIAEQAKEVSTSSALSHRISISQPSSELVTITNAFNKMLERLEKVFQNERTFFSDAAHTLKTPLAVLRSQIENSALSKKVQQEILATIDTTTATINDLLLLSRLETPMVKEENINVSKLLEQLVELAKVMGQEKNISVTSKIQNNVHIEGDKSALQKALSNLVLNAILYNKQAGSIAISLKRDERLTIVVKDSGIGIAKSEQNNIFDRFTRGSNVTHSGTGLGLAISAAVIKHHRGSIKLSSKLDQGTIITITLPTK